MKFRIVEQRGVFRIHERQPCTKSAPWYKYSEFGRVKSERWGFAEKPFWELGKRERLQYIRGADLILEFDTYKKAEGHIKKLYGIKGVESIEKPEWSVR